MKLFLYTLLSWCALLNHLLGTDGFDSTVQVAVNTDETTGEFHIFVNGNRWFSSGSVFFRANGNLYSTADRSLLLTETTHSEGRDVLGTYKESLFSYQNERGQILLASLKLYQSSIVFEQSFPQELKETSCNDADYLISGFPTFLLGREDEALGYAHWLSFYKMEDTPTAVSSELEPETSGLSRHHRVGFSTPTYGRWGPQALLPGGIGGSGVTGIFNEGGGAAGYRGNEHIVTAILSPLDSFMAASQASPRAGLRQIGIMGNVTEIPAQFSMKTLLYFDGSGINNAVQNWGILIRSLHGTKQTPNAPIGDTTLSYLGYTTDNGAYYYYNTVSGMNYQQTMLQIKSYADSVKLPYKYWLLDSWWYYQDNGVSDWSPREDVFPDGMEEVYTKTSMLVQAHNRYWSGHNVYAKQNGGDYEFLIDSNTGNALPLEQTFWDNFLGASKSAWGLRVYEQDWLKHQMDLKTPALMESVSLADMWLTQMAQGAEKNGLVIQYCMAYMRFLLQAVRYPVVTQARASGDYLDDSEQWRIGGGSGLLWALGIAPSKDGFWSTSIQAGNPYGENVTEVAPRMQAAILSLSAGPVAVGDGIGFSDVALIMRSCRADGKLLKPTTPAMTIDAVTLQAAFGRGIGSSLVRGPEGEVWAAATMLSDVKYTHLFVADLSSGWTLYPAHLGYDDRQEFWVYEANSTENVFLFSSESPLHLMACELLDFQLYTIIPIESKPDTPSKIGNNVLLWSLQGELDKWIPTSPVRFHGLARSNNGATVSASGSLGETITVGFISPEGKQVAVSCQFEAREELVISSDGNCL